MVIVVLMGIFAIIVSTGNQLIQAARVRSIITALTEYEKAIFTFKETYGYYPGDFPNTNVWLDEEIRQSCYVIIERSVDTKTTNSLTSDQIAGNGDGIVHAWYSDNFVPKTLFDPTIHEIEKASCHLYLAGLLPKNKTGRAIYVDWKTISKSYSDLESFGTGYYLDNKNALRIIGVRPNKVYINVSGGAWDRGKTSGYVRNFVSGNAIYLGSSEIGWLGEFLYQSSYKMNTLRSIDIKIDDGRPGSGKVLFSLFEDNPREPFCTKIRAWDHSNVCADDSTFTNNKNASAVLIYRPKWMNDY